MIGTHLSNRYEIVRELGRGGMGVVYLARDPLLSREVAVKVVAPAMLTPQAEERFKREARILAQMDHAAIVGIHDTGIHEGSLYIVMPLVKGKNLRAFFEEGSLHLGEVIGVGIQVAEAIEYSHSNGVVHRDIKPENILLARQGSEAGFRVRITDFGLAMTGASQRLTKTGSVVGTVAYLSPEQVSSHEADGRSDVYSLGAVLYECVVGSPPFSGEVQAVLYRLAHELPEPPRTRGADVDEALEGIIMQCLEKDPARRPQTAGELAGTLGRYRSKLLESDSEKMMPSSSMMIVIPRRRAAIPFVGREKEMAELQRRLHDSLAGECQFAVVAGEAGIGKTRLLDELETLVKVRKIRVLHGRFVEQDQSFPYQGFCDAIQEGMRLKTTSSSPIDFSDLAPELVSLFPMLREIEDIRTSMGGDARSISLPAKKVEDRTTIFEVLAGSLIRIAGGKPLVLLLEDLHAAEVSVEALQYIVRRMAPTPTLIVATYRTTEVARRHPIIRMLDGFQGDRRFVQVRLDPFLPSEHRAFLETLIGSSELDHDFVERLYEGTEGNPYFTKELVSALLDSGRIVKTETGSWNLSGETAFSSEALPATIQETVKKRIEKLPKNLRETLSMAAVIGKNFEVRDLAALAGKKEKVEDAVEKLLEVRFIEEDRDSRGDRFAFTSGIVRDVLYYALPRPKRKSYHRKYAEELEKRYAGRLERVYPQLLHHYSQGDVAEKSIEYALKLAKKSLDAFSADDALRAAKTVLDFIQQEDLENPLAEAEARSCLAAAHRMTGKTEDALKEWEEAVKIFRKEKQDLQLTQALLLAVETAWEGRKMEETRRLVERGLAAARKTKDAETLSRFLSLAATLANLRGEYEKAREYLEEAEQSQPAAKVKKEDIPTGGRLEVALPIAIIAKHPADLQIDQEVEALSNCFETLLTTDAQGSLVPFLCERWEILEQGQSFLITIRKNVRMHDGRLLTSKEAKTSFETAILRTQRKMPAPFAVILGVSEYLKGETGDVAGITVSSDDKLKIRLIEPLPIYPALLTDPCAGIALPSDNPCRFVGTGPFQIQALEPHRVILQKNPDYWRGTSPFLDVLEFRAGLTAGDIAAGFRSGEFDLARDLLPNDLEEILRDKRSGAVFVEAPKKNTYFALFNNSSPWGQLPMLRQALSGFVRTHDLVRGTVGRLAQPAEGLFPPGILGYDPGKRKALIAPDKVRELIDFSGLARPIHLRASIHPLYQDRYAPFLKALLKGWANIGVEISIETPTMQSFRESWEKTAGFDLILGRWIGDYDDPDTFTHGLFHSKVGEVRNYFSSPELDELIEQSRMESQPHLRERLCRKIEAFLMDSWYFLPFFHEIDYRVAGPKVRGLELRTTPPYVNYSELGKCESAVPAVLRKTGGGIIQVPIVGQIYDLDPSTVYTAMQHKVMTPVFETLTSLTEEARIIPWLVSEFHVEKGARNFRFRLRDNVRFHDGRRLTARDVRYSLERVLQNQKTPSRWLLSPIRGAREILNGEKKSLEEGCRILSLSEFTLELERPVSFFPAILAYILTAIVPEGENRFAASWREGCIGTGPYRVARFDPGRRLELEPNPYYWRPGYPRNDSLVFTLGVSPAEILSGFRSGRFSLASDLFPSDVEALRKETEFAAAYKETPSLSTYFMSFNIHRGPLSDPELRRRLVESIDVETIVQRRVGRLGIPARGLIPPGLLGYEPRRTVMPWTKKAPLKTEVELVGMVNSIYDGPYLPLADELFQTLQENGFRVRIVEPRYDKGPSPSEFIGLDFILVRWLADFPDADSYVYGLLHSQEGAVGNLCGIPEIDQLGEKGRIETEPALRHDIYREAEELIARNALLLPVFHEVAYGFARPELEGFDVNFSFSHVSYEKLSIRQS